MHAADQPFVTGQTLSSRVRNDFNGQVGFKFTNETHAPVIITQLGRWVVSGNNQPHDLSIYDTSATPVLLASVTVDCTEAPAGQFLYGTLSTALSLSAGASCFIVSTERQYLDSWYDYEGTSPATAPIGSIQGAWIDSSGAHMAASSNGTMFGPLTFKYSSAGAPDWTKSGTVYTTTGTLNSVASAIADASDGDTIMIPEGSFTWGAGGASATIGKAVNVLGAGQGKTIITLDSAASGTQGTLRLFGAATVGYMTINGSQTGSATPFWTGSQGGWRITHVTYDATGANGAGNGTATDDSYFIYVGNSPDGLIDNCTLIGYGSAELIFTRGPEDAWQTPDSPGTAHAIYVEDCTFAGAGYVSNFNSNSRAVVRFCTITNQLKIHAQGFDANGPPRGAREIEAYNNTFKDLAGAQAFDISGGTGYLFNNRSLDTGSDAIWFILESWGCQGYWDNDGRAVTGMTAGNPTILTTASPHGLVTGMPVKLKAPYATPALDYSGGPYIATVIDETHFSIPVTITNANAAGAWVTRDQTPFDQPLPDQIGVGKDLNGPYTGGRGSDPMYLWNNSAEGGVDWSLAWKVPDADAITVYRAQTNNFAATFTMRDMIVADRDYYKHTIGGPPFDGSSGVGIGTKAAMLTINPGRSHAGVGFWVTDEGNWNTYLPAGTSGQFYVWNGAAWVLRYAPFTYPHPARHETGQSPSIDQAFVTGGTLSSWVRNDFNGQVGFKFTNETNAPVVITQLGRWALSGNNQPHTLSIYDTSATPMLQASVTVNCAGAPADQFVYGALPTPFRLLSGASCIIVSSERQYLDNWHDYAGTYPATAPIGSIQGAWIDSSGAHISVASSGTMFGPLTFKYSSAGSPAWTKSGSIYTTTGTLNSVTSAVANASDGDTIIIPEGSFTWGGSGASAVIPRAVKVFGAGEGKTVITLDPTGPAGTQGLFQLAGAATVGYMTINGSPTGSASPFSTGSRGGWRITHITYDATGASGLGNGTATDDAYFVYVGNSPRGLIDHCAIIGYGGAELIFTRGPENAWQTPDSRGSIDAIYVEDCTFSGAGYVSNFNSNTRAVVRFCTITNQLKIDAHGFDSNGPPRSAREIEAYNNTFKDLAGAQAFDIRGGTGYFFNNRALDQVSDSIWFFLESYACQGYWDNYGSAVTGMTAGNPTILTTASAHGLVTGMPVKLKAPYATPALDYSGGPYIATVIDAIHFSIPVTITNANATGAWVTRDQTPFDQPLPDQIGVGRDVSGPYTGGRGSDPIYLWNNSVKGGVDWALKWKTPDADAIAVYRAQTNDRAATFTMQDMIVADRDYYKHTIGGPAFDGTTGVGMGTKAAMMAINPGSSRVGVGFWVTDEGNWNTKLPANTSGQFYIWDGAAWVLVYTPFVYPHPANTP